MWVLKEYTVYKMNIIHAPAGRIMMIIMLGWWKNNKSDRLSLITSGLPTDWPDVLGPEQRQVQKSQLLAVIVTMMLLLGCLDLDNQ